MSGVAQSGLVLHSSDCHAPQVVPQVVPQVLCVCVCVFQKMVHVTDFNVVAHQQESHQPHACAEEVHLDAALVFF